MEANGCHLRAETALKGGNPYIINNYEHLMSFNVGHSNTHLY